MQTNELVIRAVAMANGGVMYSEKCARCPLCGVKMQTTSSGPRAEDAAPRVRSHRCRNPECLLAALGQVVKSVEG